MHVKAPDGRIGLRKFGSLTCTASIAARTASANAIVVTAFDSVLFIGCGAVRSRDHFRPWPITAGKLVSLIDLGWSDNRIACYFGVEPVKVSALRADYGLVDHAEDSWVWRMRRRNR